MADDLTGSTSTSISSAVISGLQSVGYRKGLLEENYTFRDWFTPANDERRLVAAAFGETPVSYESALIGVAQANGMRGHSLVNAFRAFGAPILIEIDDQQIREWAVSSKQDGHALLGTYQANEIPQLFMQRAQHWKPEDFLRDKNIGSFRWQPQLDLFAGVLPELESQIQDKLDPLLRDALSTVRRVYVESSGNYPSPEALFKLVFWILTAKVFYDRRHKNFRHLTSDPDVLLDAVAAHYREAKPRLLNKQARDAATEAIWNGPIIDFRNLSVEVLSQSWPKTLVDPAIRKRLGIHRTPRAIVRYVVERTPFAKSGDDSLIVFEPCSGSASFLIGAMHRLRRSAFGLSPQQRHAYFVQHLAGIERDPFGVEISRLALTLADFPNPDGWDIKQDDVFRDGSMSGYLQRAGVVLCNPPFERLDDDQRASYNVSAAKKPVELLNRILLDLHPSGVLGFVLPRTFMDGRLYSGIRRKLAERFASIHFTVLPDRAFEDADSEITLMIASEPIPHASSRVVVRKVNDSESAWTRFYQRHEVSSEHTATLGLEDAAKGVFIPELPSIWEFLSAHRKLGAFLDKASRGLRWKRPMVAKNKMTGAKEETGARNTLVLDYEPPSGYIKGVAPQTELLMFQVPEMRYLSVRPEDRATKAWTLPWSQPKVILNKSAKSRGHWRISAFPDQEGVACYQTHLALWPSSGDYDEVILAAVLNSPVANAFVATREGKTDITVETLRQIPMPVFTESQQQRLRSLVERYQGLLREPTLPMSMPDDPERLLKEIDATVLDGYRMPPRLERELLDFFRGYERPTSHAFGEYFPKDLDVYFPLSQILSPGFAKANVGEFLKRMEGR